MWPDTRLLDLMEIDLPIIQAPMAGAADAAMAAAVGSAGGLGSLACAMLDGQAVQAQVEAFRRQSSGPINLNYFCHQIPGSAAAIVAQWLARWSSYDAEFDVDRQTAKPGPNRDPFDDRACELVEMLKPEVVSFHFGLPDPGLLRRVREVGVRVLGCATTVAEARWLEANGCDAVIAQGCEAGGHRGMFLDADIARQPGTFALVPQVVDAVSIPVVAAGGIGDGRGIAAAFALGAAGVQLGTAYLFTPEALISPMHRAALTEAEAADTVLTNVFSGRPARGLINRAVRDVGPIAVDAPPFPLASGALAPLRSAAEAQGSADFSPLWSGQAAALGELRATPNRQYPGAGDLTRALAQDALRRIAELGPRPD